MISPDPAGQARILTSPSSGRRVCRRCDWWYHHQEGRRDPPNEQARIPHLDFLDVGWGGDVAALRRALPRTFLNIRLSPVEIVSQTPEAIRSTVRQKAAESADPYLTGICRINMDRRVGDQQVAAILESVAELRRELSGDGEGG